MRFIRLDSNNIVVSTRIGAEITAGEIESALGQCGQIRQADGTFITPDPPAAEPTEEDKVNYLYYKSKGVII